MNSEQHPRRILLGVSGGIAAYKAATLVRLLRKAGHNVQVVPTPNSLAMVGKTTWEALSGQAVYIDVTEHAENVVHVNSGKTADLVIIAPATAHTIAKIAHGFADNLLTASVLVATAPVLIAPAMHTEMWLNPATQANVNLLRARGFEIIGPAEGQLTGADSGPGRMVEPEQIAQRALDRLASLPPREVAESAWPQAREADASDRGISHTDLPRMESFRQRLSEMTFLISAGGTHEPIDPVRFIGNRSTGRMGVELARSASALGAHVELVAANIDESILAQVGSGVHITRVSSTAELQDAMDSKASEADAIIMSAAVADFRPQHSDANKIKKEGDSGLRIELAQNPDVLKGLVRRRAEALRATDRGYKAHQLIVGFAAETGNDAKDHLQLGKEKARRKGADLMMINKVSNSLGFGDVETTVVAVDSKGNERGEFIGTKRRVAQQIIRLVIEQIEER
ncbi:MAG: bifunctional phosphopantothenoylcysteine decarboxylase/phosphopantothenate synthase [Actinomycetaceae bacterium]|nr:bifunctional phosphopantothenoylcysteine decarboxylase/phosphopantothenate synthase [Arcanobacterium sp.]MDD7504816.1 bifunctional phosphopantothenoylcysteine decarboxylase/phosphopantothenate synthase [Actinomycetaceae bacterium]MDY6143664.1 bifunctional phosphopantothenoylcysteine decarboxylase/phosphopantothenate synthase [Arcanobacterium sp.]